MLLKSFSFVCGVYNIYRNRSGHVFLEIASQEIFEKVVIQKNFIETRENLKNTS